MDDYFDEDVSHATPEQLGSLVKLRIQRHPSVQVFKEKKNVILRTWRVEFEVTGAKGSQIP